jgi:reactive intermediate/imine deaminase
MAGAVLGSCAALVAAGGGAAERVAGAAAAPRAAEGAERAAPVAAVPAGPDVEFLNSGRVLPTGLPFSEAVRHGDTLWLSGQIGVVPGTLQLVPGGMEAEARQTMDNIRTTLEAHGLSMADVVKCTVMLADMAEWGRFNEIYRTYFTGRFPARSALGANGLALGARVEVECIAAMPSP